MATTPTTSPTTSSTCARRSRRSAPRAVLVPVGAGLVARDSFVSTIRGVASRYGTRASVEHELARYERRGATARNRFERHVRRARTQLERELRQQRATVGRLVSDAQERIGSIG